MGIINLTQHLATPEQIAQGVINLNTQEREVLKELLTFEQIPTIEEIEARAHDIALLVINDQQTGYAMIGGAPYLMSALECALGAHGVTPVYAFSERVSVEREESGVVTKTNVFKHVGFVEIPVSVNA